MHSLGSWESIACFVACNSPGQPIQVKSICFLHPERAETSPPDDMEKDHSPSSPFLIVTGSLLDTTMRRWPSWALPLLVLAVGDMGGSFTLHEVLSMCVSSLGMYTSVLRATRRRRKRDNPLAHSQPNPWKYKKADQFPCSYVEDHRLSKVCTSMHTSRREWASTHTAHVPLYK